MPTADRIRAILLATDLQASSTHVMEAAAGIARSAGARIVLLHAVEPGPVKEVPRALRDQVAGERSAEAERGLAIQARELEELGLEVATLRCRDKPAHRAILDRLEEGDVDLVILGSRAREGRGHLIGSTADRLLRTSPVPCLVVRGGPRPPFGRVGVCTDFSARGRHAAAVAADWLGALGDEKTRVDLLHVGERYYRSLDPSFEELIRRKLEREVSTLGEAGAEGFGRLGSVLRWADHPVDGVLDAIEEQGYDLLVVGTHGHGPVRRALIGSVAMGLAQSAPCPVLVVPAPESD